MRLGVELCLCFETDYDKVLNCSVVVEKYCDRIEFGVGLLLGKGFGRDVRKNRGNSAGFPARRLNT